jgi:hypothetical protein
MFICVPERRKVSLLQELPSFRLVEAKTTVSGRRGEHSARRAATLGRRRSLGHVQDALITGGLGGKVVRVAG